MNSIIPGVMHAQERVVQMVEPAAALPNLSLSPQAGIALGWA